MRSDHSILIGSRRRPCGRGLFNPEAADGNVPNARLGRHEALPTHIDLNLFLIRIFSLEIGVDHRLVPILLCVPFIYGGFRFPGALPDLSLQTGLQALRFVERLIVQIYGAGVFAPARKIPVTVYISGVRIVAAEQTVSDTANPYISLIRHPALHFLRSGDHRPQRLCAAVCNSLFLRSGMERVHIFPIHARSNQNLISRFSDTCRVTDVPEGPFLAAISVPEGSCININLHGNSPILSEFFSPVFSQDAFGRAGIFCITIKYNISSENQGQAVHEQRQL